MDSVKYKEKMNDLLKDENVYAEKQRGFNAKESAKFNKTARKILKRSEVGKRPASARRIFKGSAAEGPA